jgi:hypothetical protein
MHLNINPFPTYNSVLKYFNLQELKNKYGKLYNIYKI